MSDAGWYVCVRKGKKGRFSALCWIYVAWVSGGMRYDVDSEGQHVCWR